MRWSSLGLAVVPAVTLVSVAGCSEDGGTSGAPTLPPIVTTSTLPPPTTLNLISQSQFYQVRAGDNLTGIADRFGVTVEDLMAKNGIQDPDAIAVGQVLELPANAVIGTTTTSSSLPAPTAAP
jgi:LysM repeat protein